MLQTVHGGAAARPFITHFNAFDLDVSLRIAPEIFLTRCVAGGIEKVYELNRNFRNEGADSTHSPEFTMLEVVERFDGTEIDLGGAWGCMASSSRSCWRRPVRSGWPARSPSAYPELVDPVIQRERLVAQYALAAKGDDEAMRPDEDFLRALEYGMPPSGGMGTGVDRLLQVFTGRGIWETILFPFVRPVLGRPLGYRAFWRYWVLAIWSVP